MSVMKTTSAVRLAGLLLCSGLLVSCTTATGDGYVPLFNGKDLTGWTAAKDKPATFEVKDGTLIVKGGRSHLFYTGNVNGGSFRNFELKLKAMTTPGANSGVYFHTKYQEKGWPEAGYECQVNSTHKDSKKTGSLYGVVNILVLKPGQKEPPGMNLKRDRAPSTDGEWFDYHITVVDRKITIRVNGEITVEYTEPEGGPENTRFAGRKLSEGTFALQAHDPKSEVHYRNIRVKVLD